MPGQTRAVVDIGTNSVKLLVAEVTGGAVSPLHETSEQTRLGQGFYETRTLRPEAIALTTAAVARLVDAAAAWEPAAVRIIATSAARDALNRAELIAAIERSVPWKVQVISGEQEAEWAFRGVTSDARLAGQDLLVLDVGGGSTEFILGRDHTRFYSGSFPLGTVRLLEHLRIPAAPSEMELLRCRAEVRRILDGPVRAALQPHLSGRTAQLVGTGGTSTILARLQLRSRHFDREQIEGTVLTGPAIAAEVRRLWSLNEEARKALEGLPPNRADVILPGSVIYDEVLQALGFPTLRVSTRGTRFAALIDEGAGWIHSGRAAGGDRGGGDPGQPASAGP